MDLDQFRSSAASIAAPVARPLFRLTTDLDLPPLPGHAAASSRHSMANLLEELIDAAGCNEIPAPARAPDQRSEEHTSELQSLMRISYAVFCLKKKKNHTQVYTPPNTYTDESQEGHK